MHELRFLHVTVQRKLDLRVDDTQGCYNSNLPVGLPKPTTAKASPNETGPVTEPLTLLFTAVVPFTVVVPVLLKVAVPPDEDTELWDELEAGAASAGRGANTNINITTSTPTFFISSHLLLFEISIPNNSFYPTCAVCSNTFFGIKKQLKPNG